MGLRHNHERYSNSNNDKSLAKGTCETGEQPVLEKSWGETLLQLQADTMHWITKCFQRFVVDGLVSVLKTILRSIFPPCELADKFAKAIGAVVSGVVSVLMKVILNVKFHVYAIKEVSKCKGGIPEKVGTYVWVFLVACGRALDGFKEVVVRNLQIDKEIANLVIGKIDALAHEFGQEEAMKTVENIKNLFAE